METVGGRLLGAAMSSQPTVATIVNAIEKIIAFRESSGPHGTDPSPPAITNASDPPATHPMNAQTTTLSHGRCRTPRSRPVNQATNKIHGRFARITEGARRLAPSEAASRLNCSGRPNVLIPVVREHDHDLSRDLGAAPERSTTSCQRTADRAGWPEAKVPIRHGRLGSETAPRPPSLPWRTSSE